MSSQPDWLDNEKVKSEVYNNIVEILSVTEIEYVIEWARQIRDDELRIVLLSTLSIRVPELKGEVFAAYSISDLETRPFVFGELAVRYPELSENYAKKSLDEIDAIFGEGWGRGL